MASWLMAQHHLLVARVELKVEGDRHVADIQIYRHTGEVRQHFHKLTLDLPAPKATSGPSDYADARTYDFDLCGELRQKLTPDAGGLQARIVVGGVEPEAPIWLLLVKPYGALGGLPWEQALEPLLDRPVLRLPDFTERPPENTRTLDIAVCCDLRAPEGVLEAEAVARTLLEQSPRAETRVYVFAPPLLHRLLKPRFQSEPRIWLAPPVRADAKSASPWTDTLIRVLAGRSLDYVHWIGRATSSLGGPSLALADPASRPGQSTRLRFCSPQALASVLTTLGAWAAGFTPSRPDEAQVLRQYADALAQARPGAVAYVADATRAGEIGRFLFAPAAEWPPLMGRDMAYCHPSRVPQALVEAQHDPQAAPNAALQNAQLFQDTVKFVVKPELTERLLSLIGRLPPAVSSANTPGFLAATQRYVEAASLEVLRAHSRDALGGASLSSPEDGAQLASNIIDASNAEDSDTVRDTLVRFQEIAASFARPSVDGENG